MSKQAGHDDGVSIREQHCQCVVNFAQMIPHVRLGLLHEVRSPRQSISRRREAAGAALFNTAFLTPSPKVFQRRNVKLVFYHSLTMTVGKFSLLMGFFARAQSPISVTTDFAILFIQVI